MSLHKELSSTRSERTMLARERRRVPDYLREQLHGLPMLFRVLRRAVKGIYRNRNGGGRANVLGFLCMHYGDRTGLMAARAAMYLARSRPHKYRGVEDPSAERYCSRCDSVLPIEDFDERSDHHCTDCYEHRRHLDDTRRERAAAVERLKYAEKQEVA